MWILSCDHHVAFCKTCGLVGTLDPDAKCVQSLFNTRGLFLCLFPIPPPPLVRWPECGAIARVCKILAFSDDHVEFELYASCCILEAVF